MERSIIEIKDITKAVPKYMTWYRYYDDIFVSVIYNNDSRKSHLRIKSSNENIKDKRDNKMCFWHSDWQYSKIENKYGLAETGKKTYEITGNYNEEMYRIDSVVGPVAIEFQHTLDVSVNEMDSRYFAHKALNYTPYLVLDLTAFKANDTLFKIPLFSLSLLDYHICSSSEIISSLLKNIRKWIGSAYNKNGNLFLDFSDQMVRFTPKLKKEFVKFSQETFLNNLLNLEQDIVDELNREKEFKEQKREAEEAEKQDRDRQNKLKYKEQVKNNKLEIETNSSFRFYRKCLKHPKIKEIISSKAYIELVKYDAFHERTNDILKKSHIYSFFLSAFSEPILELQYTTHSKKEGENYHYLFADISITQKFGRKGIIVLEFISESGTSIRKVSKKLELARGFLHSTTHPAKFDYNENESLALKEYYLFNKKVSKQEFNDLSEYCENGFFTDEKLELKYREMINELYKNDDYELIKGFCQNCIPNYSLKKYYEDKKQWQPLSAKNEW